MFAYSFIWSESWIIIMKGQGLLVSPALRVCTPNPVRIAQLMEMHGARTLTPLQLHPSCLIKL